MSTHKPSDDNNANPASGSAPCSGAGDENTQGEPLTLRESIERLRAIPGKWKELDDPLDELRKIRYGDDE